MLRLLMVSAVALCVSGASRRRAAFGDSRRRSYSGSSGPSTYARRRGSSFAAGFVAASVMSQTLSFSSYRRRRLHANGCHSGYYDCPASGCCDSNRDCSCDNLCSAETAPGTLPANATEHGIDSELGCSYEKPGTLPSGGTGSPLALLFPVVVVAGAVVWARRNGKCGGNHQVVPETPQPMMAQQGQPMMAQQGQPMMMQQGQPMMMQQGQPMMMQQGQPMMMQQGQPMMMQQGQPMMMQQGQPMMVQPPPKM